MATLRLKPKPKKRKKEPEKAKRARAEKILMELDVWRDYLPLPIGIRSTLHAYVVERDSTVSMTAMRGLMHHHCSDKRYIKNAIILAWRYHPLMGCRGSPIFGRSMIDFEERLEALKNDND